jgi:hypothetical protein
MSLKKMNFLFALLVGICTIQLTLMTKESNAQSSKEVLATTADSNSSSSSSSSSESDEDERVMIVNETVEIVIVDVVSNGTFTSNDTRLFTQDPGNTTDTQKGDEGISIFIFETTFDSNDTNLTTAHGVDLTNNSINEREEDAIVILLPPPSSVEILSKETNTEEAEEAVIYDVLALIQQAEQQQQDAGGNASNSLFSASPDPITHNDIGEEMAASSAIAAPSFISSPSAHRKWSEFGFSFLLMTTSVTILLVLIVWVRNKSLRKLAENERVLYGRNSATSDDIFGSTMEEEYLFESNYAAM